MPSSPVTDHWDPHAEAVQRDQRQAYDRMREQCPVAHSAAQGWTVFRHTDVQHILHAPETFSNVVSRHLSVPNGMDPPQHAAFRQLIEPYFGTDRVRAFEPECRRIARQLLAPIAESDTVEIMDAFARPFAARVQCAFLGWPEETAPALATWTLANQAATLQQDRGVLSQLAAEFESLVQDALERRRRQDLSGQDTTSELMRETVEGRPLDDAEIASILRNWTVGEIGTISTSVGILIHALSEHRHLQEQLRNQPDRIADAIEEGLRWHGPLVDNRRISLKPVTLDEQQLDAGERITINWVAANRDPEVFTAPETLDIDRDQSANLLWGAGIHVCPGAPLAQMELRVVLEEFLHHTSNIALEPGEAPEMAHYPASGFSRLPVRLGRQ